MRDAARVESPATVALVGLVGLASAMGVGRFAFTPMMPLMQQAGTLSFAQGGSLARANYLGLAALALERTPGVELPRSLHPGGRP